MRKFFYGFLVLMAVGLISLPFIDWQSLKQPVLNKIQSISGCDIEIKGPIHIHFFPTPSVDLNDAFLRPATEPIGNDSLQLVSAKTEKLRLSWSWVSLLKGKFDIYHFDLNNPVIILKSLSSSKKFAAQSAIKSKRPDCTKDHKAESVILGDYASKGEGYKFSLHRFAITSGKVVIDADTPKQTRIENITVSGFIKDLSGPAELAGTVAYNDIKCAFKVNASKPSQTIPVRGSVTIGYKGQTFSPLSFNGFLNTQDKQLFKTHLTIGYEDTTLILDSATDFEKDQTEAVICSKKITYQNHQLLNLRAALKIKDSEVFFNKVEGEFYDGKLDLSGHLQKNKKMALQGHLHQLNLVKIPGLQDSLLKRGRLETFFNLNLDFNNPDKCLETLEGKANLNITEGAVETIDIEALTQQIKKIKDLQSLVQGLELTKKRHILDIKSLKADFIVNRGLATTKNLEILSDPVDINGQGDIDLSRTVLNLMVKVHVKALGTLVIPFKITGSWNAPTYGIDQEQFGVLVTKNLAQHTVDTVMAQVRKQVEKTLNKGDGKAQNENGQPLKPEKIIKEVLGGLLR